MAKDCIHIGWMYPNLLNLHGERGSVQAFVRVGARLGLEVQVHRIEEPEDDIPFQDLDLLIFLPGELVTLTRLKPFLEPKLEQCNAFLERGGYLLSIGTTGMLFGNQVTREDGSVFQGLGLLPVSGQERQYVLGDDLHFQVNGVEHPIIGSQIHMVNVDSQAALGNTLYGFGNNGTGSEGARVQNLIYTNCLGPVFVKNPWWAEAILREVSGVQSPKLEYPLEDASYETCCRFLKEKPAFTAK